MNRIVEPRRRSARAVGILILGGYLAYGVGSSIVTGITGAPDYLAGPADSEAITIGALMMLVNSALVIAIGALMYPILRHISPGIALGYFGTRMFEGIFMAVGIVSILTLAAIGAGAGAGTAPDQSRLESAATLLIAGNLVAYNVAMAGLGIGSLFFCHLLLTSGLVPRFLGVWGFVGYAVLAAGCVLELLGYTGAGLVATIPGGLWEVFFAVWLIVKGFNPRAAADSMK